MLEYIEEYKKYIILFFIFIFLFIFCFFYFSKDEVAKKEIRKELIKEKKEEIIKSNIFKEKVEKKVLKAPLIKKEKVNKRAKKPKENKKEYVLINTSSNKGRYSIKLVSSKKIKSSNRNSKYIVLTGRLENEEGKNFLFHLSLKEEHLKDTSILKLKIKDNKTKIKSQCDGYFLDTLSVDFSYYMKIEVYGNSANCYISSQNHSEEDYLEKNFENIFKKKQIKLSDKKYSKKIKINEILKDIPSSGN